jgi:hypothetical protein
MVPGCAAVFHVGLHLDAARIEHRLSSQLCRDFVLCDAHLGEEVRRNDTAEGDTIALQVNSDAVLARLFEKGRGAQR